MWDREAARFADHHRTIRLDLRGFGSSPPASAPFSYGQDLRAVLDHLGVRSAFVVGSSMGGAFAIDLALEHPERVAGLLLVAPGLSGGIEPPFDPDERAALEYDEQQSKKVADAWSRGDRSAAFEGLRGLWCSALEGANLELFRTMVEQNTAEVFENRSGAQATAAPAAEARLGSVRARTTLLVGDRDNPSSAVFAKRIARGIPGARLRTVAGADHLVNLSRPSEFEAALRSALSDR